MTFCNVFFFCLFVGFFCLFVCVFAFFASTATAITKTKTDKTNKNWKQHTKNRDFSPRNVLKEPVRYFDVIQLQSDTGFQSTRNLNYWQRLGVGFTHSFTNWLCFYLVTTRKGFPFTFFLFVCLLCFTSCQHYFSDLAVITFPGVFHHNVVHGVRLGPFQCMLAVMVALGDEGRRLSHKLIVDQKPPQQFAFTFIPTIHIHINMFSYKSCSAFYLCCRVHSALYDPYCVSAS